MKLSRFDFKLPEKLIAQYPPKNREDARLLVLNKENGNIIDSSIKNLTDFLNPDDLLVFNNSKVIPARLHGQKENGSYLEVLLLKKIQSNLYKCLIQKSKRNKIKTKLSFFYRTNFNQKKITGTIIKDLEHGEKLMQFSQDLNHSILDKIGSMPIPPYIRRGQAENIDKKRYQTTFARFNGSGAAPTAGLHFSKKILNQLKQKKIEYAFITLHVGLSTFQPIRTENIEDHLMHTEDYTIPAATVRKIKNAETIGKRIIPVGTTSLRTLEGNIIEHKLLQTGSFSTKLYIYPGYQFQLCKHLFTNFHTPKSSLFVLVCTLAGEENIKQAYEHAIRNEYRFFSYGDAMLIL